MGMDESHKTLSRNVTFQPKHNILVVCYSAKNPILLVVEKKKKKSKLVYMHYGNIFALNLI